LGGYNFVLRDSDVYNSDSHGTSVLSTMGGYTETKLVGTAPDVLLFVYYGRC
jgi:subtilisin family serine protease